MKKIFCALVAAVFCLISCCTAYATEATVNETVDSLFQLENEKVLFDEEFLKSAGTTAGDWYVIALKSLGKEAEYSKYLDALSAYVKEKYETENKLHSVKATEWHRIALAVEACGGEAKNLDGIDLISDGVFQRDFDKQGINAYLWGLITLCSGDYQSPENALNTKESITEKILSSQLADGGFALSGSMGDPDVTAIAITALSGVSENEDVKKCIEKAVDFLSQNQLSNGGYQSYGIENCESAAQVIIALCAVGIDPDTDAGFVKNGASVLDNVMSYKTDEGFSHLPDGEMNFLATQQSLMAIAAYNKLGQGSVYAFIEEYEIEMEASSDVSEADRELIKAFGENVNASDIPTIKRLIETVENCETDDEFVLMTVLEVSLSKAEKIQESVDYINKKALDISQTGVKFSHRKTVEKLFADYEKLSEADKKLVENYDLLLEIEAELDTIVRERVIMIVLFTLIVLCGSYLVIRAKKHSKKDD